jgi:hypothetical protein
LLSNFSSKNIDNNISTEVGISTEYGDKYSIRNVVLGVKEKYVACEGT